MYGWQRSRIPACACGDAWAGSAPPRPRLSCRPTKETDMKRLFGGRDDAPGPFPVRFSDAEWRRKLSPDRYHVLRKHGTERAGTSALNAEKRAGTFVCAGCGQPLFASETKFESGTGWPSFYAPLD